MMILAAETSGLAINWHSVLFWLTSLLACGFGAAVLFSSNVVRMAFYLILSLASTAGMFFLAGAFFLGAMQIMIYVGGTLVLLIFGVMLTAQAAYVSLKTSAAEWVSGLVVGAALLLVLVQAAVSVPSWRVAREDQASVTVAEINSPTKIGLSLMNVRVENVNDPVTEGDLAGLSSSAGKSGYLLPFEIVSIHLLIVLIGAAFLARAKRRISPSSEVR